MSIARAMYRAVLEEDPQDPARLESLQHIGKTLRAVLKPSDEPPGTIEHGEAWLAAERATKALGELVGTLALAPIFAATAKRIARKSGTVR